MADLQLGLIGDNISSSSAPRLHRLAGCQNGLDVRYDRLVPAELGKSFDEILADCRATGFRGINVTYPYKEIAARKVTIEDPQVRRIGAVNTIRFEDGAAFGFNTDYTGFIGGYRAVRGDKAPGVVGVAGAGGVGRAVTFGLLTLGASEIRLFDRDAEKAETLARALQEAGTETRVAASASPAEMARDTTGLINCTQLGMVGYPGSAIPRDLMVGQEWAFDAVYTPIDTAFLLDAAAEGMQIISGYELFFFQGVHAWSIFSDLPLDEDRLRQDLASGAD